MSFRFATLGTLTAMIAFGLASADRGGLRAEEATEPAKQSQFATPGPIAEAPLQIGCWAPLCIETPPWIFPMVYHIYPLLPPHEPQISVEEYAMRFVKTIKSFPPDRPVWIQAHRWLGDYGAQGDPRNILHHALDNTPGGTPGIWPEKGAKLWADNTRRFLKVLKENGCRLDMWPLDHETGVSEWSAGWSQPWTFKNIVLDPRWKTTPAPGCSLIGAQLLDPASLAADEPAWTRNYSFRKDVPDSRIAYEYAKLLAIRMPVTALNEYFAKIVLEEYPHAVVCDYDKYNRQMFEPMFESDLSKEIWARMLKLCPDLAKGSPRMGNAEAVVLYGSNQTLKLYPKAKDMAEALLMFTDEVIARCGDPALITPWVPLPSSVGGYHGDLPERMPPDQYERLLVGLAERGVRKFILWFAPGEYEGKQNTREAGQEFLAVAHKAYRAAEERLKRAEANGK